MHSKEKKQQSMLEEMVSQLKIINYVKGIDSVKLTSDQSIYRTLDQ